MFISSIVTTESKSKANTETKTNKQNNHHQQKHTKSLGLTFSVLLPFLRSPPLTKILMVL